MVYKYPRAQKFFDSPLSTHFGEEVHELLVVDVEFPGLEMVKIKVFLSFDNLLAMLEERHLSNWDVPASLEWYIEEIGATEIQAASVAPSMLEGVEPALGMTTPSTTKLEEPTIEPIFTLQQPSASVAPTVDKGKGLFFVTEEEICSSNKVKGNCHWCFCCPYDSYICEGGGARVEK